jgi:hypothetical protein
VDGRPYGCFFPPDDNEAMGAAVAKIAAERPLGKPFVIEVKREKF